MVACLQTEIGDVCTETSVEGQGVGIPGEQAESGRGTGSG